MARQRVRRAAFAKTEPPTAPSSAAVDPNHEPYRKPAAARRGSCDEDRRRGLQSRTDERSQEVAGRLTLCDDRPAAGRSEAQNEGRSIDTFDATFAAFHGLRQERSNDLEARVQFAVADVALIDASVTRR